MAPLLTLRIGFITNEAQNVEQAKANALVKVPDAEGNIILFGNSGFSAG